MASRHPWALDAFDSVSPAAFMTKIGLVQGTIFYVNSNTGSNSYDGVEPGAPKATIVGAISAASAGDTILVAETHAETITAAGTIDVSKAGLKIIGRGMGTRKPTITLGTATTATFKVSAANVFISNLRFVSNIDSLVKFLDLTEDLCEVEDCDFVTSSGKEATSFIGLTTTKDNFKFRRCTFFQPTDPAGTDGAANTGGIYMVDSEHILVDECSFIGNFETACIHNLTTAAKYLDVRRTYMYQALSGAEPFQLVDGCIGSARDGCFFHTPAETGATEATLFGTLGDKFFINPDCGGGNDGAAGGQGGIIAATAS